jgi:homoserine/homoserine lactone efflux protein
VALNVWLSFCIAGLLISLSPGPGAVFAMSTGAQRGYLRALPGVAGMQVGVALQLLVVAVGLGALLATSQYAFDAIKWFGALYLIWLGWKQFTGTGAIGGSDRSAGQVESGPIGSDSRLFMRGVLVNASNPKATIFLLAVLPQFMDSSRSMATQYLVIAATLSAIDIVVMSGYVLLASRLLGLLRSPRNARWIDRGFGTLFLAAGVALAGWKRPA